MKRVSKWVCACLVLAVMLSLSVPAMAVEAVPSDMRLEINGYYQAVPAYLIGGSNYYKLRDIATLFCSPEMAAQFNVTFDQASKTVYVTTGTEYVYVGGELKGNDGKARSCVKSDWKLEVNGKSVSCSAYMIGGNNYFKLRDLAKAIGFEVDYDATSRTVYIFADFVRPPQGADEIGCYLVIDKNTYDAAGQLIRTDKKRLKDDVC